MSIQDVVSAIVTGSSGATIITRLPTVGTGKRIISFILRTYHSGPSGRLNLELCHPEVAKVTKDDLTTPVANEPVTFSIILDNSTGHVTRIDNVTTQVGYATTPSTLTVNTDA
ncbi:MAG: hypothetical protein MZV70_52405 [Desulfobacterales bacterium]|nr:hypothetical protein [Desulfobacterales bacterium]